MQYFRIRLILLHTNNVQGSIIKKCILEAFKFNFLTSLVTISHLALIVGIILRWLQYHRCLSLMWGLGVHIGDHCKMVDIFSYC